jgi:hypothetical protein
MDASTMDEQVHEVNSSGDHGCLGGIEGDGRAARGWCFASLTLQGIRSSPFQLALTVLTMSVGAMALALTFFVGRGATERVWQDVEQMMGQWVIAYSDAGLDPRWLGGRPRPDFTESELRELKNRLPEAKWVCPIYMSAHPVVYRDRKIVLPVDGITEEISREPLFQPLRGPGFSASAQIGVAWECMVTETASREFAINIDHQPLLLVGGQPYRVVGVVPDPPRIDRRFQGRVVVPYRSARILWIPVGTVGHILVAWRRVQDMNWIVAHLREGLDEVRGPNTYFLSSSQFSVEKSKDLVTNFILLGAAESFFCIVVASIGVLNVMLTNVTRRTHEFSIRLAMGASRHQILGSVVFESVLISLFGAFLGIAIAVVVAPHLTELLAARLPEANLLAPLYCSEGFLYPLLVCCLCGLAAGVLPALRAGRVDVLAALRAEG